MHISLAFHTDMIIANCALSIVIIFDALRENAVVGRYDVSLTQPWLLGLKLQMFTKAKDTSRGNTIKEKRGGLQSCLNKKLLRAVKNTVL